MFGHFISSPLLICFHVLYVLNLDRGHGWEEVIGDKLSNLPCDHVIVCGLSGREIGELDNFDLFSLETLVWQVLGAPGLFYHQKSALRRRGFRSAPA
jgi:hypothetical protein